MCVCVGFQVVIVYYVALARFWSESNVTEKRRSLGRNAVVDDVDYDDDDDQDNVAVCDFLRCERRQRVFVRVCC